MHSEDMTALIVDDDAHVRSFLRSTLRSLFGCNLLEASTGEAAFELYKQCKVDIVFLDIQMPGRDGLKILEDLKSIDGKVKVVIVSAHGTADNVKTAIERGAVGFILKPFHMKKVKAIVEKLVGTTAKV